MSYFYQANLNPFDRFDKLTFQRDNGTTAIIQKGFYYDLTASEVARARKYVNLVNSVTPANAAPLSVVEIPVQGNPNAGDIPVWDATLGVFVPQPNTGGSGGTTTVLPTADPGGIMPSGTLRDFLDSIGVNVHLFFTSSKINAYEDHTAVRTALADLGLPLARDTYFNSATHRTRIRSIAKDLSMRWQLIFDPRIDSHVGFGSVVVSGTTNSANALTHAGNALDIFTANNVLECSAIEVINEPDIQSFWGTSTGNASAETTRMANAKAYLLALKQAKDARTSLVSVPILSPSAADPQNLDLMGDISSYADLGNLHSYPGGFTPRANLKGSNQSLLGWINHARVNVPKGLLIASETGYHTTWPQTTGHAGTTEAVQGVYSAQLIFEYWRHGVSRSFFYELFDQLRTAGTLGAAVTTTTATLITLQTAYPTDFPTSGNFTIRIDNEAMIVTAGHSTTTLTVTRAQLGTAGATHASGAEVSLVTSVASGTNQENRFGLKRYDRSDKPAATILKRIVARLADSRRGLLYPLNFNLVSSAGDTVRHVLLQASDGSWWLAVWNDVSIWDPTTGAVQSPGTVTATLDLHTARTLTVYSPTVQDAAVDTAVGVTTRTLSLPAAAVVLVHIV